MHQTLRIGTILVAAALLAGITPPCAAPVARADAFPGAKPQADRPTWLLHLPGIAGEKWVDVQMTGGLRDAGFRDAMEIYDWTGSDPGLGSLLALKRNHEEAEKISKLIESRFRANPAGRIILTAHSGGTGLIVWALEDLPDDVKVDTVCLLASALSPDYDLSKALRHVTGKCYVFCSENDVLVLDTGTKVFGTIDGKKTFSAGEYGFFLPDGADTTQYEKLVQKPYDRDWVRYHNHGDHIGCMSRLFSRNIIAPLLFPGIQPDPSAGAAAPAPHARRSFSRQPQQARRNPQPDARP